MQLSVPLIPDETYIDFLSTRSQHLSSVYFPLYSGPVLDARMRFVSTGVHDIVRALDRIACKKKYCLLNTRFVHPDRYDDKPFMTSLLDNLEILASQCSLTGIVVNDFYLLNALSAAHAGFLSSLEAVPGVNMMIDSAQKIPPLFDMIKQSGFRLPSKIILDRSVNRDIQKIRQIRQSLRHQFPDLQIELLANEGCILHCPFKLSHDAHIALANTGCVKDSTHQINTRLGCHAYFMNTPERFLQSPFIRPEEVRLFENVADSLKLCGRTLGTKYLRIVIKAWIGQSFEGNLFELMDAAHWLSEHYHLDNKKLDPGFFDLLSSCTKDCNTCRICDDLFNKAATQKPLTIKAYKDVI